MRGKIKINSYIWLSLETLKEVKITKEGLVIHHHPDMCTCTTVMAEKNRRKQKIYVHAYLKHNLTVGYCFKIKIKNTLSLSFVAAEEKARN